MTLRASLLKPVGAADRAPDAEDGAGVPPLTSAFTNDYFGCRVSRGWQKDCNRMRLRGHVCAARAGALAAAPERIDGSKEGCLSDRVFNLVCIMAGKPYSVVPQASLLLQAWKTAWSN